MLAWIEAGCRLRSETFRDSRGNERELTWLLAELTGCENVMPSGAIQELNERLLEPFDLELRRGATYGDAVERLRTIRQRKGIGV